MPSAIQFRRTVLAIGFAASVLAFGPNAFAAAGPPPGVSTALAAVVADASRTDSASATDAEWKPEELAFSDAKPGNRVADAQRSSESRAVAGNAMAQAPDAGCALPSEPWGIPAALDAAISGPADKDRACMKALLIPEAHLIFASVGADGAPNYRLQTLDDWIARTKTRGHVVLKEKQLNFRIDRYDDIAHLWSLYVLHSGGNAVARGINSIEAVRQAGGWRVASITVRAESASAPLPEEYLP